MSASRRQAEPLSGPVMVYGATGFSGRAIAEQLCGAGHDVILAGRSEAGLRAVAEPLSTPFRVFDLRDPAALTLGLAGVAVVVHAAGPYLDTAAPMMEACIRAGVHYLDLSGEWPSFAQAQSLGSQAADTGVMLMPGIGFWIVGTDCLLAHAAQQAPDAVLLRVASSLPPVVSRGTFRTALGLLAGRVIVRRSGVVTSIPAGSLQRTFDFGLGERRSLAMSLPDVITGQQTTGVASIEAYLEAPAPFRWAWLTGAHAAEVHGSSSVRSKLSPLSRLWPEQPTTEAQSHAVNSIVVEAVDPWRRTTRFGMQTRDGYLVTVRTTQAVVARVLAGEHPSGFQTPAGVFGAGLLRDMDCAWDFDAGPLAPAGRRVGRPAPAAAS
jgi:saccharopine dehydrogenase (NAD+, L-lysine-forming)